MSVALRLRGGLPLAVQILLVLVAALLLAQALSLVSSFLLNPGAARYEMQEVASVLAGKASAKESGYLISQQPDAPKLEEGGWIVPVRAREELADRLDLRPEDIRLYFFAPLTPSFLFEGTGRTFVAGVRTERGWRIVWPEPEPFPSPRERHMLIAFALAFALVTPLVWLGARRVVRPVVRFTEATERLGRDPLAPFSALDGPSEIVRAVRAFNRLQDRLRSFVDGRTVMIGAIAHDLRAPLSRMRFRLEEASDPVRESMLGEIAEMEAMINSALAFVQQASAPGTRQRVDLVALVQSVAADATSIGGDVSYDRLDAASIEGDPLALRRLLANLVDNALKYGERARIALRVEREEAVVEIADRGPGLPETELERVFLPFYRSSNARYSDKRGSGLGLAVSRSIARAHGGDVRLRRDGERFVAELRLPTAP